MQKNVHRTIYNIWQAFKTAAELYCSCFTMLKKFTACIWACVHELIITCANVEVCAAVWEGGCLRLLPLSVNVCQSASEAMSPAVCLRERTRVCVCMRVCVHDCWRDLSLSGPHISGTVCVDTLPEGERVCRGWGEQRFPTAAALSLGPASAFQGCQRSVNVWTALNK